MAALLLVSLNSTLAATRTWDGSASGNWSNGANWVGGNAPQAGDDLVFPAGATRFTVTNNYAANTTFNSITFSGSNYVVRGNAMRLAGDGATVLEADFVNGAVTFEPSITLVGTNATAVFRAGGNNSVSLFVEGNVNLNQHDLYFLSTSVQLIHMVGAISGSGNVVVDGGTVFFRGSTPNTYTGLTGVGGISTFGRLYLDKTAGVTAIPGDVVPVGGFFFLPGELIWLQSNQIADDATVTFYGTLDLNGHTDAIGDLRHFLQMDVDGGTLTVNGHLELADTGLYSTDAEVNGTGRISFPAGAHSIIHNLYYFRVNLELTGAGNLIKGSSNALILTASNSFTGTLTITNGRVLLLHSKALGSAASGTIVTDGASLLLDNNITIAGETLTMSGPGDLDNGYAALHSLEGTNQWNGNIILGGNTSMACDDGYELRINGTISGAGSLTLTRRGQITFGGSSANTYSGFTFVKAGILALNKTSGLAVPGSLTIGDGIALAEPEDVLLMRPQQIADDATVAVNVEAGFYLNGFNETIGDLLMVAGLVDLDGGTLTLADRLSATSATNLNTDVPEAALILGPGRLQLTPTTHDFEIFDGPTGTELYIGAEISGFASIRKTEDGTLSLFGSNSFTGTFTVEEGFVTPASPFAFGNTAGGTVVSNGAAIVMAAGAMIGDEPLTLSGTGVTNSGALFVTANSEWQGDIVLASNSTVRVNSARTLTLSGAISGAGELRKIGIGTLRLAGNTDNTMTDQVFVTGGTLRLAKTGGHAAIATELQIGDVDIEVETVISEGPNQIADTALVIMSEDTLWNLSSFSETIGNLRSTSAGDSGEIALGSGTLTVQLVDANSSGNFPGPITGTGGFTKRGAGGFILQGNNTYTGSTLVQNGALWIDGEQPSSPVTVLTGATLAGHGTSGHVQNNPGSTILPAIAPYDALSTSNLTLNGGSFFNGRLLGNGTNSQVNVRGVVTLNSPTLALDLLYLPSVGDTFRLIQNDGVETVTGTFAGIPGGMFTGPGGLTWDMTYGNDVTMKLVSQGVTPLPPGGSNYLDIIVVGGNGNGAVDPNECLQLYIPLFNDTDSNKPPFSVTLSSSATGLIFHQPFSSYPALAPGEGAYNLTPFQISTPGHLLCGTNLPLRATIKYGTNAPFVVPVLLPTGAPGSEQRFDSTDVPQAIPDGGRITNTIVVPVFAGVLARVEVSINVPHDLASDVAMTLVAPNGLQIPLTAAHGNGPNYGTGCPDGQRTRFAMTATQFVGNAAAPFVGTFRPLGNLNLLRGLSGDDVVGKWSLRVADNGHFNFGSLACWSVHLFEATCIDGGGACEQCPGAIAGRLGAGDPLTLGIPVPAGETFEPSQCNETQQAVAIPGSVPFDRYAFTNHSSKPTCVTVTLSSACNGSSSVWSAAYSNVFNPQVVVSNYLGSIGLPPSAQTPSRSYSIAVAPLARFEVIVSGLYSSEGCGAYTLNVESPTICPVALRLTALATNRMRLDWPNYAVGYGLETRQAFPAGNWNSVTNTPVVTNGRLVVTNEVTTQTGFYRLKEN